MAYQKLQAGKAWEVNRSDNTDIPNTGLDGVSGTTTTGSATQLIDASRTGTDIGNLVTLNFLEAGVQMGMIIVNTTDGTQTTVKQVVNATTLDVDQNIFAEHTKASAADRSRMPKKTASHDHAPTAQQYNLPIENHPFLHH